jgi:hypothetical protein
MVSISVLGFSMATVRLDESRSRKGGAHSISDALEWMCCNYSFSWFRQIGNC